MKAEHRKELQANTLIASMNRLAQRVKTRPQRRTVLWVVLGLIVVAVVGGYFWLRNQRVQRSSEMWALVDFPTKTNMEELLSADNRDTPQGRAVRFQYLWMLLWDKAIKRLVIDPRGGQESIEAIQKSYEKLADEVKDDPSLAAEARYNIAAAQEALAVNNPKNLEEAARLYKRVADDYPDTARGREAKDRFKLLDNRDSRRRIEEVYAEISPTGGLPGFLHPSFGKGGKLPFPVPGGAAPGGR